MVTEVRVEFRVLGRFELVHEERHVQLGHAKQRSVLAVLLIEAGHVVPAETLVDRVWGYEPPDTAISVLYGYLTRLRKALAEVGTGVERRSGGYVLDVDPDTVDLHRFRRLIAAAETETEPGAVATAYDAALAIWRGAPFADLPSPWLRAVRERLVEEHLTAVL